jgi:hypothetical protein
MSGEIPQQKKIQLEHRAMSRPAIDRSFCEFQILKEMAPEPLGEETALQLTPFITDRATNFVRWREIASTNLFGEVPITEYLISENLSVMTPL